MSTNDALQRQSPGRDSFATLIAAMKGIPAFGVSFALIAWIWNEHARWSRRYGLDDRVTTRLSLLLVFLVLVYVYPLKALFGSFFAWISGGWLPAGYMMQTLDDLRLMFAVYAIAWSTLGLVVVTLYRHAWRQRDALALGARSASNCADAWPRGAWFRLPESCRCWSPHSWSRQRHECMDCRE